MARLVVLEFEDNDVADKFCEHWKELVATDWVNEEPPPTSEEIGRRLSRLAGVTLLAKLQFMFQKPTKFCDCPGTSKRVKGWSKGKKYGWWVHECGKPSKNWASSIRAVISSSRNLLQPDSQKRVDLGDGLPPRW